MNRTFLCAQFNSFTVHLNENKNYFYKTSKPYPFVRKNIAADVKYVQIICVLCTGVKVMQSPSFLQGQCSDVQKKNICTVLLYSLFMVGLSHHRVNKRET